MLCRSKTVRQWVTSDHTQGLSWHDTWWWWVFFPPDSDGGSESVFPYWTRLALNLKGGGALYWKGERALCCYRDLKWLTELKCVQQRLAAGFLCHVGSCCSSMKHVSFRVAKFQRTERWRQKWRVKNTSAFWGSVQKWEIPSHVNVPNFTALKKKGLKFYLMDCSNLKSTAIQVFIKWLKIPMKISCWAAVNSFIELISSCKAAKRALESTVL